MIFHAGRSYFGSHVNNPEMGQLPFIWHERGNIVSLCTDDTAFLAYGSISSESLAGGEGLDRVDNVAYCQRKYISFDHTFYYSPWGVSCFLSGILRILHLTSVPGFQAAACSFHIVLMATQHRTAYSQRHDPCDQVMSCSSPLVPPQHTSSRYQRQVSSGQLPAKPTELLLRRT